MTDIQDDACAAMGATTEAHDRMKPFAGTFRATVTMWCGAGEPMVSTGTMENTFDLGGRFLRQTYTGDPCDGPFGGFEGRGYWGFNTATGKYEGFWIDSASTFMQNEVGDVDGAGRVWTMEGIFTNPESGAPMTKRTVISLVSDDHHVATMFFVMPDGNEHKAMEIAYTRTTG